MKSFAEYLGELGYEQSEIYPNGSTLWSNSIDNSAVWMNAEGAII